MNPGSIVIVDKDGERFRRAFFSFHNRVTGFKRGCRPLLFVDGTHLLGKYKGTLLGAMSKDGNEGFFHVAFAIVDNETDGKWMWFLAKLGDALYGDDDYDKIITFVSGRSKGLVNAIAKVFPSAPHAYCLRHLEANFMKGNVRFGKALKEECWSIIVRITYAYTTKEYDVAVNDLIAASADAHRWILQKSDVSHWSNNIFKGERLGEMYSNVAESFNSWIKEARHLPVTNMVDSIRFKLMIMLCNLREHSRQWETHRCLDIYNKLEEIVEESCTLLIGSSDGDHFKVVEQNSNSVNLLLRTCSCRRWQVYSLPCKHACAARMLTYTSVHRYVDDYFTVEAYRLAYVEAFFPVPDNDKLTDANCELLLRLPCTKRQPGHPRQKMIESQESGVRELHCSRCHKAGHNRRSCNAPITD